MSMSKGRTSETITEGVTEHPAVQAWLQVQSTFSEPGSLELLQLRRNSTVYRFREVRRDGPTVIAKRCLKGTALIERRIYEELLPLTRMPALRCYGYLEEPEGDYVWLFLEDAEGIRFSPQIPQHRALAGSWLGELHFGVALTDFKSSLPDRDLDYYLRLLRNCRAMLLRHLEVAALPIADASVFRNVATYLDELELLWDELVKICEVMPRTLVHNDFVTKNLRVRDTPKGPALLVFDWEFAGWGTPAADLAQFFDRAVSPDLEVYGSILNHRHSDLGRRDIQAVAACGNVLRLVNQISWATVGHEFVLPAQLVKAASLLQSYEPSMLGALNTFQESCA